jgi:predicted membrane protein
MPEPRKKAVSEKADPPANKKARDANVILAAYIFSPTIIIPLLLYLMKEEKGTEREKYHCLQAVAFGIVTVLMVMTLLLSVIGAIVYLYGLLIAYWLYTGKSDDRPLGKYLEHHA